MDLWSELPPRWREPDVTLDGMPAFPLKDCCYSQPPAQDLALIFPGSDLSSMIAVKRGENVSETGMSMKNMGSNVLPVAAMQAGHQLLETRSRVLRNRDLLLSDNTNQSVSTARKIESDGDRPRVLRPTTTPSIVSIASHHHQQVDDHTLAPFHNYQDPTQISLIDAPESFSTPSSIPSCSIPFGVPPVVDIAQSADQVEHPLSHLPCGLLAIGGLPHGASPASEGYALHMGSDFSPMDIDMLLGAEIDGNRARRAIQTHPLYPYLVSAHMDCYKVGAEAADLQKLEEVNWKYQHLQLALNNDCSTTSNSHSELDSVMSWYLGILLDLKEKVEEPFLAEMEWCKEIYEEVKLLGPVIAPAAVTGCGAEGLGPTKTGDSRGYTDGETTEGSRVLPFDQKDGVTVDRTADEYAVKEWLKWRHDPCDIRNLREQCRKKRRQGKHSETARERLVEWFNGHGEWPYPSEDEKLQLAEQTKLEGRQINNWFINQRKRHWENSAKEEAMRRVQHELESQERVAGLEKFLFDLHVPLSLEMSSGSAR